MHDVDVRGDHGAFELHGYVACAALVAAVGIVLHAPGVASNLELPGGDMLTPLEHHLRPRVAFDLEPVVPARLRDDDGRGGGEQGDGGNVGVPEADQVL